MNTFKAFCLLVLTLLVFSQESPVLPNTKVIMMTTQGDVEVLKKIITVPHLFRIPTDVPANCTLNALGCFGGMLNELEKKHKYDENVTNTIANIVTNIQEIMKMKFKRTVRTRELCSSKQCTFSMVIKNTPAVLEDFSALLKRLNSEQ